jgi:hypothetical protein
MPAPEFPLRRFGLLSGFSIKKIWPVSKTPLFLDVQSKNMKQFLFALAAVLLFAACTGDSTQRAAIPAETNSLSLLTNAGEGWQYENMRILPILADDKLTAANAGLKNLKTVEAAMQTPGFRITELKQFGRTREQQVNALTVQNKTQDTVLLFSGDVVTGGKQDRVIAQDYVILPASVRNIEVFCVEKNRWQFHGDSSAVEEGKNEKIYAFSGYYNVASPSVRKAVRNSGSQEEVWSAVAKVTSANQATSATNTYAALDNDSEIKGKRDAYLRFFDGKSLSEPKMVGMAVVSGDKLLGVDIFAHPDLFKRRFKALLHGYVAEAATRTGGNPIHNTSAAETRFNTILRQIQPGQQRSDVAGKFEYRGKWIHLYSK